MAVSGIDFASLSLKDALDLASLIEEEAQERYLEFADQMDLHHTPEAATFFRFMAENEARHGRELAERRTGLFGSAPCTVTRAMLWDVEAPDYDQARLSMSARQAMEAALRSERKAHSFFCAALPGITDPQVRTLFEELREEEVQHQELVSREIARLPPDPGIDPTAFEDDPVAQ